MMRKNVKILLIFLCLGRAALAQELAPETEVSRWTLFAQGLYGLLWTQGDFKLAIENPSSLPQFDVEQSFPMTFRDREFGAGIGASFQSTPALGWVVKLQTVSGTSGKKKLTSSLGTDFEADLKVRHWLFFPLGYQGFWKPFFLRAWIGLGREVGRLSTTIPHHGASEYVQTGLALSTELGFDVDLFGRYGLQLGGQFLTFDGFSEEVIVHNVGAFTQQTVTLEKRRVYQMLLTLALRVNI